jgi:hypothetical protein
LARRETAGDVGRHTVANRIEHRDGAERSAGVRVNQFLSEPRSATLYPGVHFVLPLIENLKTYSVRDEVFATVW